MTRLERITRDAAEALGKDVTAWTWDQGLCGLRTADAGGHEIVFNPLADPSTAYALEDELQLSVRYLCNDTGLILFVTSEKIGGGVTHRVPEDGESLLARMFAVTQYAALFLTAREVKHG